MKLEKTYNRLVILNEDRVGDRAEKLVDLIYAYVDAASVSGMDVLAAAEIALGEKGDLVPNEKRSVIPVLMVVPEGATDVEVFASGDPDWVTWEWAIAVVDGKVVQLQAITVAEAEHLLPSELLGAARRIVDALQQWGEYDDSDSEDEEASDEDSDSEDEDDFDESE